MRRDDPKREKVVSSCSFEIMAKAVIIIYTEKALKKNGVEKIRFLKDTSHYTNRNDCQVTRSTSSYVETT